MADFPRPIETKADSYCGYWGGGPITPKQDLHLEIKNKTSSSSDVSDGKLYKGDYINSKDEGSFVKQRSYNKNSVNAPDQNEWRSIKSKRGYDERVKEPFVAEFEHHLAFSGNSIYALDQGSGRKNDYDHQRMKSAEKAFLSHLNTEGATTSKESPLLIGKYTNGNTREVGECNSSLNLQPNESEKLNAYEYSSVGRKRMKSKVNAANSSAVMTVLQHEERPAVVNSKGSSNLPSTGGMAAHNSQPFIVDTLTDEQIYQRMSFEITRDSLFYIRHQDIRPNSPKRKWIERNECSPPVSMVPSTSRPSVSGRVTNDIGYHSSAKRPRLVGDPMYSGIVGVNFPGLGLPTTAHGSNYSPTRMHSRYASGSSVEAELPVLNNSRRLVENSHSTKEISGNPHTRNALGHPVTENPTSTNGTTFSVSRKPDFTKKPNHPVKETSVTYPSLHPVFVSNNIKNNCGYPVLRNHDSVQVLRRQTTEGHSAFKPYCSSTTGTGVPYSTVGTGILHPVTEGTENFHQLTGRLDSTTAGL
ncbi:uncharacterized protein [Macrobrachium rosenbergii]|uniref:uncharacterized protein n=1 Tax=Macrobrachium rosenbergii TaxID=79674 RepID=UPI0034D4E708